MKNSPKILEMSLNTGKTTAISHTTEFRSKVMDILKSSPDDIHYRISYTYMTSTVDLCA